MLSCERLECTRKELAPAEKWLKKAISLYLLFFNLRSYTPVMVLHIAE